jgi:pyruvate/2-oxoglutarate/acetoin dehydrogenase E1 component
MDWNLMDKDRIVTVLESLNLGLHHAFEENESVLLLGEDVLDPYGGAFKITRGLSTDFPGRVITTPISEAGIIGVAGGMALRGLRPVVEIMFGDFLTLGADQIINHLAKFRDMYNNQVTVPVVIRTPMGGRRGYGPTHSQTLEKHFLGVPGLRVLAPFHIKGNNPLGAPGRLLADAILNTLDPVLFIENKLQYLLPLMTPGTHPDQQVEEITGGSANGPSTFKVSIANAPKAQVSLATYGYMAHLAMQAQLNLAFEHEIFIELIIPTQLGPFELDPVVTNSNQTGRLLTLEEGTAGLDWGAEVIARVSEALGSGLQRSRRITAQSCQVPAGRKLEDAVLPQVNDIVEVVQRMLER